MKRSLIIIIFSILCIMFTGCGKEEFSEQEYDTIEEGSKEDFIYIGFSQLGAESDWRSANTESMKNTFSTQNGFKLIFEDGQQKQSNQITAIRKFIQQEVDYIVLAPVTENGWDTVLQEAKDAGIPVIIVDRMVAVADDSLFTCRVGPDFALEGKKAVEWLNQFTKAKNISPKDIHIVNIQGTLGASSQIGRTKSLSDAAKAYGWDLTAEKSGDFTQTKGKEVMEQFLKQYDNINVVYCENDDEAYGAIEAIEAAGKTVGSDIMNGEIMIISFDGVRREAMNYVLNGKISCIAECNPLLGPYVKEVIEILEEGKKPDKYLYVEEKIFSDNNTVRKITIDGTDYDVITPDRINIMF